MHKFRAGFGTRRRRFLSVAILIATAGSFALGMFFATLGKAQGQTQKAAPIKFEFDVATIKLNKSGELGRFLTDVEAIPTSGMFRAHNMPLIDVIRETYHLDLGMGADDGRLSGAPAWLSSDQFDIEAKIDPATIEALQKLPPDERKLQGRLIMQALFADRLKLAVHTENKDLPIYSLVVAKNGPKLQESKPVDPAADGSQPQGTPSAPGGRGGRGARGGVQMFGRGGPVRGLDVPIANLLPLLSRIVGRTVVDKTGLTGKYDFTLQWTPDETQSSTIAPFGLAPDPTGPSIFAAIQEQLGLKLEPGKAPLPVLVIDHVERPSDN